MWSDISTDAQEVTIVQTKHPLMSPYLTHKPKQQPNPDHMIRTHFIFPLSWAFVISVLWPEAEHFLLAVVTTTGRPDGKQSQDGTANMKSLWQAELSKVGLSTLSTFYQCFLLVRFREQTETLTYSPVCFQADIKMNECINTSCLCVFGCTHLFWCTVG